LWPGWTEALIIVKPETVICWHRAGFRLFWRWRSRHRRPGRPKVSEEIRQLIRRMKTENPTWGAPRIHGELLQLGFDISEPTVSRYLRRLGRNRDESRAKRWLAFLNNHREVIAAFDFFTVPTITFRVLYCFFVIEHGRRRILHFNSTAHPTSDWIVQQLREALPLPCRYRYMLFDRDAKFGSDVFEFLKASGIKSIRTSVRSPWQNGIAERWVGSARREILDHVIPLNEQHLRRLGRDYLAYYHDDRIHIGLAKQTPSRRSIQFCPGPTSEVVALPRIGGLHHRYTWSAAA
jgi:transposase InsO family protein